MMLFEDWVRQDRERGKAEEIGERGNAEEIGEIGKAALDFHKAKLALFQKRTLKR